MEAYLNKVINMDCLLFLKLLPDNSIDSCVTDPPYGLQFMGVGWDRLDGRVARDGADFDTKGGKHKPTSPQDNVRTKLSEGRKIQLWHQQWATEVHRVLKPGAHLISFSGTRTYHRLACAIEDAGFEIRDQIHWLYGSGFPKGLNLGDGFNTQLKPAHEPMVLARKQVSEKTIKANMERWGTGGIQIDDCRVSVNPAVDDIGKTTKRKTRDSETWREGSGFTNPENPNAGVLPSGRYPANLVLSHHEDCQVIHHGETVITTKERDRLLKTGEHPVGKSGIYGKGKRSAHETEFGGTPDIWKCVEGCPIRIINQQSGLLKSSPVNFEHVGWKHHGNKGETMTRLEWQQAYRDSGGAARFFYCAKPSKKERTAGLNAANPHITVKPLKLMRWLVRLITPRGGVVLDPFLGSGTTAIAAQNEGFNWIACEISEEYCEVSRKRIEALRDPQSKLEEFIE
jgi:site-specific DNA-methyltransferase (adenine-specific)